MPQRFLGVINRMLRVFDARLVRASTYRSSDSIPLDGSVDLSAVQTMIADPLQLIFLGSLGDTFTVPGNLADSVKIYSLDAVSPGSGNGSGVQVFPLTEVVAGSSGPMRFVERATTGVSSALQPKTELIEIYGLADHYRRAREHDVDAVTLAELADRNQIPDWDFIMTDLEGLDFEVICGLGERVRNTSLIQMELRFEPFYEGEPLFHEVVDYLHQRNFEILDLRPERWRARTPNMMYARRGRVVFCNCYFVNRDVLNRTPRALVRQALILGLCGYANFAERVLESIRQDHPDVVRQVTDLFFSRRGSPYLPMPELPNVTHGTND